MRQIIAPAGAPAEAWQAYSTEAAALAAKAGRHVAQGSDEDGGEMA